MSASSPLIQEKPHPPLNLALPLRRPAHLIAGGLFIITLLLYLSTLAPSVVALFDDSLEFQLVTYQLGIAHPTGYPLYTLLGKLFTLIPVGNIAYRVNLMSAVFGALTAALLYLLIVRLTPEPTSLVKAGDGVEALAGPPPKGSTPSAPDTAIGSITDPSWAAGWMKHLGAIFGALVLAVGLTFWQQATVAEVYTLNAFFVALLLYTATSPQDQTLNKLLWLAFLSGLALTHHRTILLLLPALALYLLLAYGARLFKLKAMLLAGLLGLAPLLLYLYLPLRGHIGSLDGSYENSWAGFWRQVSASGYGLFISGNPLSQERDFSFYWTLLADQFYTTVPGFIGLVYLFQAGRYKSLALTGLAFLSYFVFNIFYNVADIEVFFIPTFLIWAIWSGLGAIFLLETGVKLKKKSWRLPMTALYTIIFLVIIFQLFQSNRAVLDQSYSWQVHDYGIDILQSLPAEEEAAIVGILGEMTLIRYYQQTENRRPEVETVAADLEADRLAAVEKLLAAGKTVYLTRELPGAPEHWSLGAAGPLIRVNPEPMIIPPPFAINVNQTVTPEINLLGYTPTRRPHTGPGPAPVRLTLFWQVNQPPAADLKVSARLLDTAGVVQAVVDAVPVHFAYPTSAWRPGEIVADVYDLALQVGTPPGRYTPLIIWYDPVQNAAEVGRVELAPISIE